MSAPVRIFVSSPADVGHERIRAERVAERLNGLFDGIEIQVFRWEHNQYYSAHESFQAAIPPVENFDIVVGILWSRLGTALPVSFPKMPTGEAYPSGTAYEILKAIEHRQSPEITHPDVLIYRKTAPIALEKADDLKGNKARLADLEGLNLFVSRWFANSEEGFKAAFTGFETTDQFEELFEEHLRSWLRENRRLGRERLWRIEEKGSPFVGLSAFDENHSEVFFGRRRDIERARERLEEANSRGVGFLLIEGGSGAGKSSLAKAGLLPRLRQINPDQIQCAMTPVMNVAATADNGSVIDSLAFVLFDDPILAAAFRQGDYQSPNALANHLSAIGEIDPILRALDRSGEIIRGLENRDTAPDLSLTLLVDQFEQAFANDVSESDRSLFTKILSELARSGRAQVIISLRVNDRPQALLLPDLKDLIDGGDKHSGASLSLATPMADGLAEIVREPARAAAIGFEKTAAHVGLDELLISDAGASDALPFLQFTLDRLYRLARQRRDEGGQADQEIDSADDVLTLSVSDYEAIGGLEGAIASEAEAAIGNLPDTVNRYLPQLIRGLVEGSADAPVLLSPSVEKLGTTAELNLLIDTLVDARILTRDRNESTDQETIRLSHQRVISAWPRAKEALEKAKLFIRVRDDITRSEARWAKTPRHDLLLPAGIQLDEAELVVRHYGKELTSNLRDYVSRSRRRTNLSKRLTALAATLLAFVAAGAVWSIVQSVDQIQRSNEKILKLEEQVEVFDRDMKENDAKISLTVSDYNDELIYKIAQLLSASEYDRATAVLAKIIQKTEEHDLRYSYTNEVIRIIYHYTEIEMDFSVVENEKMIATFFKYAPEECDLALHRDPKLSPCWPGSNE